MEPRSGGEIYVFWSSDTAEQFYVGPGTASSLPCTQHLVNVISSPVNTMPRYSFPTTNLSISFLWTHVFRFIYLGFLTKNLKKKTWCKASYLLSHLKPKRLLHVGDALGDKVTSGGRWPGRWCSVVSYDGGPLLMSHWILSWLIWTHSTYSTILVQFSQEPPHPPASQDKSFWSQTNISTNWSSSSL